MQLTTLRTSEDSVSCWLCLLSGHSLWNGTFREHPPFDVPDAEGSFLPLALGGFYMFLTMIILLQVGSPLSLMLKKPVANTCTTRNKNQWQPQERTHRTDMDRCPLLSCGSLKISTFGVKEGPGPLCEGNLPPDKSGEKHLSGSST